MALSVTGLTKHYDSGFTLDDVTFDLPSGYIMGLVGPNGAGITMHEPVKVTDAIGFAAMTVLTLVLLNTIVQPFLYRFSPYRAMAAIILSIGVIGGHGHRTAQGIAGIRKDRRTAGRGDQPAPSHCISGILDHRRTRLSVLQQDITAYLR